MTQNILTGTILAKEGARLFDNRLSFVKLMNRNYQSDWSGLPKPGDSITIRKPAHWKVRSGANLSAEELIEQPITMTMGNEKGVDANITSREMNLSLDMISDRKLKPQMSRLASDTEAYFINDCANNALNFQSSVSTNLGFIDVVNMRAKMVERAMPDEDVYLFANPTDQAYLISDTKGNFQDSSALSSQFLKGRLNKTYGGFECFETNLLNTITPPADVLGAVTTTLTNGGTSLVVKNFGADQVIPAGAIITTPLVLSVNPETKQSTGRPFTMRVTTATTLSGTGTGTLTIEPLFDSTDSRQNVTALPLEDAVLTIAGTASTAYRQILGVHPDAYTIAFADLDIPSGVDMAQKVTVNGITMTYIQDFDIKTKSYNSRWDIMYAGSRLRNEWACIGSDF